MNRLEPLDWLRGFLAFSIMLYHLTCWGFREPDASSVIGRLGVYGVSMFFVISGLSMAAAYHAKMRDLPRSAGRFFIRRVFRIWPLLWVTVAAATLGWALKGQPVDGWMLFLNLTTLFGFVDPGAYINTGAWSIGNEMVYYALTPALLVLYNKGRWLGNALLFLAFCIGGLFAFHLLEPEVTLAAQWGTYIHPFNNLFFYAAGVALFYNTRYTSRLRGGSLLVGALVIFAAWLADGDLIVVVTGGHRVVFALASLALVLGFFKLSTRPPAFVARPLAAFGAATYGVYLLHPLVHGVVRLLGGRLGLSDASLVLSAATVMLTIVTALISYSLFEALLIRLGKRISTPREVVA